MKRRTLQVVYENGIDSAEPTLSAEQRWLQEQGNRFTNEWVALDGGRLVSHGTDPKSVFDEARAAGVASPFFVRVTNREDLSFGGW